MIKYEREENGVKVSLEIDNEQYNSEDVVKLIEQINTTIEIKDLTPKYGFRHDEEGNNNG